MLGIRGCRLEEKHTPNLHPILHQKIYSCFFSICFYYAPTVLRHAERWAVLYILTEVGPFYFLCRSFPRVFYADFINFCNADSCIINDSINKMWL